MKQQQEDALVKPLFHYNYKNEGAILDSQYNYQGNILAVCNSNGQIYFYSAEVDEQNREVIFLLEKKKTNDKRNAAVLKIAWSLPNFGFFASASVSKQIDLYQFEKMTMIPYLCKKMEYIPLVIAFCPIQSEAILTVALSDGSISLLNQNLEEITNQKAHEEAVNCLAWNHRIFTFYKNKWVTNNFPQVKKFTTNEQYPLLISGSSDTTIKIWKYQQRQLIQLYRMKAHLKPVRDLQWKPNYLSHLEGTIISCSEDGSVKLWQVKQTLKGITLEQKEQRNFGGPVYRANFNFMGNLIAVSFCNESESRIETAVMKQKNGAMLGEKLNLQN